MNKDEVKAHLVFKKMQQNQALLDDFEKLRPNWKGSVIRFTSMVLSTAFLLWLNPEIMHQPLLYVFLILIFGMSAELHSESKKINKRIDALHRLLKDDV